MPTPTVVLHTAKHGRFTASLPDGTPLVTRPITSPIFAACRTLVALGFADGPARFRHSGSRNIYDASVRSIHQAAALTVSEEDCRGLRTVKWVEKGQEAHQSPPLSPYRPNHRRQKLGAPHPHRRVN
ncbi:hypothetical protein RLW55_16815 [Hyphomicrobium sp. B1]|uniref:hypothetical protein n=1 Tax=Hyphomicrobium sp. B1 TaxID=3075651 RepID=UPI003C2CC015